MPIIIPGFDTQQEAETTTKDDAAMNSLISTRAADGWLVGNLIIDGSNAVFLFTRNVTIEA